MAKPGYATYIKDRLTGFSGDSPRRPPADLALYPAYLKKIHAAGETPSIIRQRCTGPVAVRDRKPLADDLARLDAAMKSGPPAGGLHDRRIAWRDRELPAERVLSEPRGVSRGARRGDAGGVRGDHARRLRAAGGLPRSRDGPPHHVRGGDRRGLPPVRGAERRGAQPRARQHAQPSRCACTCAGATTRGRTCATSRCARSSARCCRRSRRGSRSRRRIPATATNGRCSRRSASRTTRSCCRA